MNRKEIGNALRMLRGSKPQTEVCEAVGIGRSALNNYELGLRIPRDEIKVKLANYYGKSVQELFFSGDNTKRAV